MNAAGRSRIRPAALLADTAAGVCPGVPDGAEAAGVTRLGAGVAVVAPDRSPPEPLRLAVVAR